MFRRNISVKSFIYNTLEMHITLCLLIVMVGLMGVYLASCSSSVEDEEQKQNLEQPDLEVLLKDVVLIPAGEFLTCLPSACACRTCLPSAQAGADRLAQAGG